MVDPVERRLQVRVQHPHPATCRPACGHIDGLDRVLTATAGPKSIGPRLEPGLPLGLQRIGDNTLIGAVADHRNPQRATAPVLLGHIHPPDRLGRPGTRSLLHPVGQIRLLGRHQRRLPVDPGGLAASVDLRHPAHAQQGVRAGSDHQLLQVPDLFQVPSLRRREDPLPQASYVVLGLAPVHLAPVQDLVLRSVRRVGVQLVPRFRRRHPSALHRLTRLTSAPFQAGAPAPIRSVMRKSPAEAPVVRLPGSRCLFGYRPSLLEPSCARWGVEPSSRSAYRTEVRTPSGLSCCT